MTNARLKLNSNFFYKLLASYMLIICIPLAIIGVLYVKAGSEISRQNHLFASEQANYTRNAFENSVAEINRLLNALLSDDDVRTVIYGRNPLAEHERTYSVLKTQRRLYTFAVGSRLYGDILIYHRSEDFIITSDAVYLRPELFPESYGRKYPGYDWSESFFERFSHDQISSEKWLIYPSSDGESSMLLRATSIAGSDREVYVVLPVNIADLLTRLAPEYSGSIIALDPEGRCMTGNAALWQALSLDEATRLATDADGRQYLYSDSQTICGIRLIHLKGYSIAEDAAAALRTSFAVLLAFVVLSSIALCLAMTFFQTRPLYRILELLFGKMPTQLSACSWEVLSGRIEQLIHDNRALYDKRQSQIRETKKYMMDALFAHTEDPDEIVARMDRLGMNPHDAFHLLTFFFESTEDCAKVVDSITIHFPEAFSCSIVDGRSLVILVRSADICESDANSRLIALRGECGRMGVARPRVALDPIPELVCADIFYREQLMTTEITSSESAEQVLHINNDIFSDQDIFYPRRWSSRSPRACSPAAPPRSPARSTSSAMKISPCAASRT